jgi:hypothetical protein
MQKFQLLIEVTTINIVLDWPSVLTVHNIFFTMTLRQTKLERLSKPSLFRLAKSILRSLPLRTLLFYNGPGQTL